MVDNHCCATRPNQYTLGRGRYDEGNVTESMAFSSAVSTRPNYARSAAYDLLLEEYDRLLDEAYPLSVNGRPLEVGLYAETVQPSTRAVRRGVTYYEFSTVQVRFAWNIVAPRRHLVGRGMTCSVS